MSAPTLRKQRGIALITAMLVMALASIAAAAILVSANAAIHRTATLIDGEKAWWYAQGLESWVRGVLQRDAQNSQIDARTEDWAKKVDYLPVDQGALRGHLEDLQGRFNLNNLGSTKAKYYQEQLVRLFQNIPDLDPSLAQPLAEAIKDWIDADQIPSGSGGAEDTDYQSLPQPYRAANQPMLGVSELLAIKGMSRETYELLAPYISVLPLGAGQTPTPVNVNTVLRPVLLSLTATPNLQKMDELLSAQETKPVSDLQPLRTDGTLPADIPPEAVDVKTRFFLMQGVAFIGSGRVALYSVLMRPPQGPPIVISRSLDSP